MHEPSDTTPDPSGDTEAATCENCGADLSPMDWETLDDGETTNDDDGAGYGDALYFCDEECIAEWKAGQ